MDLVIDFAPTGHVESMYSDEFSLGFLGPQKVRRASHILFDEDTQSWSIALVSKDGTSKLLQCGFATYEGARRYEVDYLNRCRIDGGDPMEGCAG